MGKMKALYIKQLEEEEWETKTQYDIPKFRYVKTIEHDDYAVDYHCTFETGDEGDRWNPPTDTEVCIEKAMTSLKDVNGKYINVDVLSLMRNTIDWDEEVIEDHVREEIDNDDKY